MAAGAVGVLTKPVSGLRQFLEEEAGEVVRAIRAAASANMRQVRAAPPQSAPAAQSPAPGAQPPSPAAQSPAPAAPVVPRRPPAAGGALSVTTDRLVAVGTSTGGTQALEKLVTALPRLAVGVVVVQHMPAEFTAAFARRLDEVCPADVTEAAEGDRVLPGRILIAPGGRHMAVVRDGAQYRVRISDGPRVNRHKPSVDVLFESAARFVGANALGVILTGMGDDGSRGLLQMREAGAHTIGQDESTCVVYGMPKAARDIGAVETELPLGAIPDAVLHFANRHPAQAAR